jgi:predicted MFS family arabinose efflux permease
MSKLKQDAPTSKRSVWLAIAVGWLAQLGLKTFLPIVVLVGLRLWLPETSSNALLLEHPDDTRHSAWYEMQAAVFIGSVIAGALAALLAPRRTLILSIALVVLSLLATAFEQFPQPFTNMVNLIWTGGPCLGLVVGILLVRFLKRDKV